MRLTQALHVGLQRTSDAKSWYWNEGPVYENDIGMKDCRGMIFPTFQASTIYILSMLP